MSDHSNLILSKKLQTIYSSSIPRMLTKIVAVVLLLKAVSCQDDELSDADVKNLQTAGVIPIE